MRNIEQCEGCYYPLGSMFDEYERGEVNVTWLLCHYHDDDVTEYAETMQAEYDALYPTYEMPEH